MKAIDFELRGNVARIYLGTDDLDHWWGDDWDDTPYEHNAGKVYEEFVAGHVDVAFPFDAIVLQPCDGQWNSPWCKQDMQAGKVPMLAVLAEPTDDAWAYEDSFESLMARHDLEPWLLHMGDAVNGDFGETLPAGAVVIGRHEQG